MYDLLVDTRHEKANNETETCHLIMIHLYSIMAPGEDPMQFK